MKKLVSSIVAVMAAGIITFGTIFSALASTDIIGDVDGDGKVTISDATMLQCHIAELVTLDDQSLERGDVDGDGKITVNDITTLQKYIAELITQFPAETKPTTQPTSEQTTTVPYATDKDGYSDIIFRP